MNNTALITGASGGIGKELAKIHASKGGDVILVARSENKLNALAKELENTHNITATVIAMDLAKIGAGTELYDAVKEKNIEIDILINNAGFGGQGYFHERDWEKDKSMIQLNILTLTELTRMFLPEFVARKSGKILQVSSTASFMPGPLQAVYFATKTYVQFFSNALSRELQWTGVTVTNLMPGPVETGFEKAANLGNTNLMRWAVWPESVAKDGYEAMEKWKIDVISGLSFKQKLLFAFLPFIPKKMKLDMIFKIQEKKK